MSSEQADPAGGDKLNLTDPKAMRALAHPVRMALLDLLAATPTLTATQASEVLGESPANCAFHLRTLAKYGFVREAGGGKGRERPWAAAHRTINLQTAGQPDEQAELAAAALGKVWVERSLERTRRALTADSWPDGWADAVCASDNTRFLTAEELIGASAEIRDIIDRYQGRLHDPASRPPGSLPVRIDYIAYPDPDLTALNSIQSAALTEARAAAAEQEP